MGTPHHLPNINMPEMTETLTTKPEEESNENDSGTDSDGDDDSIPELEETAGETAEDAAVTAAAAAGLSEDASSKAKQSRGEKKARKIMSNALTSTLPYLFSPGHDHNAPNAVSASATGADRRFDSFYFSLSVRQSKSDSKMG